MQFKNQNSINLILFLIILLWCIGIFSEYLINIFPTIFYVFPFLKYNYSIVCHTQPEKLINYFGFHTLVCARCTGIYIGSLISIILVILGFKKNVSTKTLIYFSLPMFLDVFFTSFSIYQYLHFIAFVSGLLLGSVGFSYIHKQILVLFSKEKE